ncbi:SgcJ/EcaC family oxidoreductase [Streptomyces sp. NPDC015350]|uniref:SgcJ/EcaC family oxidoreductase n=1 Tax=Streptomyces sp. NPDC015350 TaxID=3364955 RepID=UPI0036F9963E
MSTETAAPGPVTASPGPGPATTGRSRRRTVKRVLGIGALALALAAGGGYLWLSSTATVHNTGNPDCMAVTPTDAPAGAHRQVCSTLADMTAAWGRGDADAYGAVFTEDATCTTYVGTHYQGRRDIAEGHAALFDGFLKGTEPADSYLGIRFYGPRTAIVTTRGEVSRKPPRRLGKIATYTLVRTDRRGRRIAAVQKTRRKGLLEAVSFRLQPATGPATAGG